MFRYAKPIIFSLALVFLPSLLYAWDGRVVSIISGDTITVLKDSKQITIRLAGVDCPEKGQPFGRDAEKFTRSMAAEKSVKVWPAGTDQSGRMLAFLFVGQKNLNKELLAAGLAWHYKKYSRDPELAKLEFAARKKKTGLWSQPNPIAPWEWREK